MIVKEKKFKHKKKKVTLKQDKKIRKMTNSSIIETVSLEDKKVEIKRPIFYLEAKDIFFEEINSDA